MSSRYPQTSKVRSVSAAYACPACQTIIGVADRCPNCGFTGADSMTYFAGRVPVLDPVVDDAGLFSPGDLKTIARARKRAARRLPQFRWSVCAVNLPEETNLRLFGFWLLNAAPLRADEAKGDRLWTVLLAINAATSRAAVVPGYGAEPWLGGDHWAKAVGAMSDGWKHGEYGDSVASFIITAEEMLKTVWKRQHHD